MFIERTGQELRLHDRFLWTIPMNGEFDCYLAHVISIDLLEDAELVIRARCDEHGCTGFCVRVRQGALTLKSWERIGL